MDNIVYIQLKDVSGRWFTVNTVRNTDQTVNRALSDANKNFKKTARAITPAGAVVNITG